MCFRNKNHISYVVQSFGSMTLERGPIISIAILSLLLLWTWSGKQRRKSNKCSYCQDNFLFPKNRDVLESVGYYIKEDDCLLFKISPVNLVVGWKDVKILSYSYPFLAFFLQLSHYQMCTLCLLSNKLIISTWGSQALRCVVPTRRQSRGKKMENLLIAKYRMKESQYLFLCSILEAHHSVKAYSYK